TIQFNRIHSNVVGIQTVGGDNVNHNVLFRNTGQAILIDHDDTVTITSNTIYTPSGDGVRIRNNSRNVSLHNNIIWTANGYDVYVATNSQPDFKSDYNNLFASGNGIPVWWQKDFNDLFDWQVEAAYDTHSIGYTVPDPTLDNPRFVDLANDDYHPTPIVPPSIDAGDPNSVFNPEPGDGGARIDLGAYGNTSQASTPPPAYIRVDFPSFYTDWVYNTGHPILWHSYNVSGNVNVALYDSTNTTL